MASDYLPILILLIVALGFAIVGITLSTLVGPKKASDQKLIPYESGMTPVGPARRRFPIKFYLVAMLFLLFDVAVVFLYPWAVVFREFRLLGLVEAVVFIAILLVGFYYIWKRGALEWR